MGSLVLAKNFEMNLLLKIIVPFIKHHYQLWSNCPTGSEGRRGMVWRWSNFLPLTFSHLGRRDSFKSVLIQSLNWKFQCLSFWHWNCRNCLEEIFLGRNLGNEILETPWFDFVFLLNFVLGIVYGQFAPLSVCSCPFATIFCDCFVLSFFIWLYTVYIKMLLCTVLPIYRLAGEIFLTETGRVR